MNPDVLKAIATVHEAAREQRMTPVLVGALVTEMASEQSRDLPVPRRTLDADFAVQVNDWAAYLQLGESLVRRGATRDPRVEHRFRIEKAIVDLLPYGPGVSTSGGTLRWPSSDFEMSVAGFAEACAAATDVRIAAGAVVRCVTVPGLVLLKMSAFLDRAARQDPKHRNDAEDILYWLKHYASGDDSSRRFDLPSLHIEDVDFDSAGAAVLGRDVRKFVNSGIQSLVDRFLTMAGDPHGMLVSAVLSPRHDDDRIEKERDRVVRLLKAFRSGLESRAE